MNNNTVPNPSLFRRLYAALMATEQAKAAEAEVRTEVLAFMKDEHPSTVRTEWGQVQYVLTDKIVYRDGAVTAAQRTVDKLAAQLAEAKKILKGAQEAAKVRGGARARVVDSTPSIRVVKGDDK